MIINVFCEMLSHFFHDKGKGTNQTVASLIVLYQH